MTELFVKINGDIQVFALRDGKPLFVGRSTECDVLLPSPAVSRRHAVFLSRNGEYGVKDMNSSNGTYLNGKRVSKPARLRHGDIIRIADYYLEVRDFVPESAGPPTSMEINRDTTIFRAKPEDEPVSSHTASTTGIRKKTDSGNFRPPSDKVAASDIVPSLAPAIPNQQAMPDIPSLPEKAENWQNTPAAAAPSLPPAPAAPPKPEAKVSPVVKPGHFTTNNPTPAASAAPVASRPRLVRPPKRTAFVDSEAEEEGDDVAFLLDEEGAPNEDANAAGQAALVKAAAEAGIVGEFAPDIEEEGGYFPDVPGRSGAYAVHNEAASGVTTIPILPALRQAVEGRLLLYSFLADMKQERADFIVRRPKMHDIVKSELARQDRELDKIPSPEQAEGMMEKREAKLAALEEKIAEAKANVLPPPPKPSRDMREAEEMAISQWTICIQSAREALPEVYREAFRLMEDEPLAEPLRKAGVDPQALMGGGAYYLALESLAEEAKAERQRLRGLIANLPDPSDKKNSRVLRIFNKGNVEGRNIAAEPVSTLMELAEAELYQANRAAWIAQELAFLERMLIREYWRVYTEAALFYLPRESGVPFAIRAFLRHGVIGFKGWWMTGETRENLFDNCTQDVVERLEVGRDKTGILYADEYLAAVMNLECTPALDENLEINERNSSNWKADKAFRKLINARSQTLLLEELVGRLTEQIDILNANAAKVDDRIANLLADTKNHKQLKNELAQQRQAYRVEITKLTKLANKIKDETVATLRETEAETEARFASGELPRPERDFLIRRECEALHKIGRLLANLKERFMPLAVRDSFAVGTDAVNDRSSIAAELAEMERRDPALFLENIVPSKKKASRIDLRISPVVVIIPSAGLLAYSWNPRSRPEDGRLALPTCFIRRRLRERQLTYLLADFRWDTSKAAAGMDILTSDTFVAAFMAVRWDWRKRTKEGREKGLIYSEQNDRTNWRRVYEAYSQTAYDSGKKLFNRNYDFYERIIGKYFDLPENVPLLKK